MEIHRRGGRVRVGYTRGDPVVAMCVLLPGVTVTPGGDHVFGQGLDGVEPPVMVAFGVSAGFEQTADGFSLREGLGLG